MDEEQPTGNNALLKKKPDSEIQTLLKSDDCNIQYGGVSANDDDVPSNDSDGKNQSLCTRLYGILVTLTIEPAVFSFMFGYVMNMTILSNMMMDKGCLYYYNYSSEICKNLSAYETEKSKVEVLAADYSLYSNLLNFLAAFVMIFIAPWSDKYGRKFPLIISVIGALLTDVGYILCAYYFDSRLEYLILSKVPTELLGGFICVLTIMFSLASEQSSTKNRTLKYTSLEIALGLGISTGTLTGGFLYGSYGYFSIFVACAALHVFGCLWILFVVEETTGLDVDMKWHEKAKDFFSWKSFTDGISATCKPRPGNTRALLLTLLVAMTVIVINYESLASIAYVYVHHVYNWDPTIFSMVNTISMLLSFVVSLLLVPIFIRAFHFNDFTLGIIGTVSIMAKNLCIAFSAPHTYIYYTGVVVGMFTALGSLSIRSALSKLVERDELGRVFSFLAACEILIPMLGTTALTKVFEATMDIFPNVTYTMVSVLLIVPLITFIWASKSTKSAYNTLSVTSNDHVRAKV